MNKTPLRRLLCAACFALAVAPFPLAAQTASAAKDPLVRSVSVQAEGGAVSEQFVLGFVAVRKGEPLSRESVANTVRALFETGRFAQAVVEPRLDAKTGEVDVVIIVEPRPAVRAIEYVGGEGLVDPDAAGRWFGSGAALEDVKVGELLDPAVLRKAEVKLQGELRKKRPFALVSSEVVKVAGGVKVRVKIREGVELRVDQVRVLGASALTEDEVISGSDLKATSWRWWKFSWLVSGGRLDPDAYREDCRKVRDFYRKKGFLDVEIAEMDPEKACVVKDVSGGDGWVDVNIRVKEGRRYAVGALEISGNRLGASDPIFSTVSLQKIVAEPSLRRGARPQEFDRLAKGDWYATEAVEAAADKLKEYYGQMGYLNAQVEVSRKPNLATGAIDVGFKVEEGQRFSVRSVEIQGNTKTRSSVIARELALGPGEVFDLARARVSEARLRNTQFFEEVRVAPVPTPVPGQSDLRVTVKEGPTGQVSFGAGYSTVEQLVGFVEYSEGNFDFTNPDGWYRGGGQKFRVRVSAGSVSNSFEHSFEEPALWDRDLAVGYKLERRYAGYQSSNYNVITEGAGVYARRRIYGAVEGRIAYDLRRVSVGSVTANAPLDVKAEDGQPKVISSVTLSAIRDTRDEYNFPTKGSRVSLTEEIAGTGLGGDVKYLKSELRAGKWFLVSPTAEQTFGLVGRVGLLTGTGASMPFYERFYLGGAYDMRGFDYNKVGGLSTFDNSVAGQYQPTGGLSYGYLSGEYTIKAADNLRFAAFVDYGVVNRGETDFGLSEANADYGLGMRILLGGAVMRLDFGFPLQTTQDAGGVEVNGGGMKFNFSFGTVF